MLPSNYVRASMTILHCGSVDEFSQLEEPRNIHCAGPKLETGFLQTYSIHLKQEWQQIIVGVFKRTEIWCVNRSIYQVPTCIKCNSSSRGLANSIVSNLHWFSRNKLLRRGKSEKIFSKNDPGSTTASKLKISRFLQHFKSS